MKYTGERYCREDNEASLMALEHLHRYQWVAAYAQNKKVLDIACGEGYGASILAEKAEQVYGGDIDGQVIAEAKIKYPQVCFKEMSAEKLDFEDKMFDMAVSFETLEHLDEDAQRRMLAEIKRVLKDDGVLFVSTPNIESKLYIKHNKFHKRELSQTEFKTLLQNYFSEVQVIGQYIGVCSILSDNAGGDLRQDFALDEKSIKYFMAICGNQSCHVNSSVKMENSCGLIYKLHVVRNFCAKFGFLYLMVKKICERWK